jgi:hypothetical protein
MTARATKTINGADQWTDVVRINGYFNLSIVGTLGGTIVTVQRRFSTTDTWRDVDTFDAATEVFGMEPENAYYRVGVKAAQYVGGPVEVRFGQEGGFSGRA